MSSLKDKLKFGCFVAVMLTGTGCIHPVATMFETADSLDKGETKITLAGTYNPEIESNQGNSFVGIVDHGISPNQDIRCRVERRQEVGTSYPQNYSFFEFGSKWSFAEHAAFALPIQAYLPDDEDAGYIFLDPRFILSTKNAEENFEVSSVIHVQTGFVDGDFGVIPGAALGFGIGDLNNNAVRLDVGWNIMNQLTFGFGVQFMKTKE